MVLSEQANQKKQIQLQRMIKQNVTALKTTVNELKEKIITKEDVESMVAKMNENRPEANNTQIEFLQSNVDQVQFELRNQLSIIQSINERPNSQADQTPQLKNELHKMVNNQQKHLSKLEQKVQE